MTELNKHQKVNFKIKIPELNEKSLNMSKGLFDDKFKL